jgi:mono/diheme cytochrome c family protein
MSVLTVPFAVLITTALAVAQTATATGGIYSAAQANRGRIVVENHCTSCHGDALNGLEGPALVGNAFMLNWERTDLDALFRKIRDTMPPAEVASVTEDEKLDALAYLLQQNGFPEGPSELSRSSEARARIPLGQPAAPPRTGSLVRVAGCLSEGEGKTWRLTSASEPLANQTVQLLNVFPDPSPHKGHAVDVSGLLVRDTAGISLNVISLAARSDATQRCDVDAVVRPPDK